MNTINKFLPILRKQREDSNKQNQRQNRQHYNRCQRNKNNHKELLGTLIYKQIR